MLRTSNFRTGFLAIALSATALVTVTVPASAHMSCASQPMMESCKTSMN